jgi:hypothetical protein
MEDNQGRTGEDIQKGTDIGGRSGEDGKGRRVREGSQWRTVR